MVVVGVVVVVLLLLLDDNVTLFVVVKVAGDASASVVGEVSGDEEYFSRAINFNRLIASNACRFSYKSLFIGMEEMEKERSL